MDNDTNGNYDIFVHDRQTGTTERVCLASDDTQGNSTSYKPSISSDGRYITFNSWSNNLVDNDTNNVEDIFLVTNPLYHALGNGTSDFTLQIGANNSTDNQMTFGIDSITTDSLKLTHTDVDSLSEAQRTINALDEAIDFINDQRSNLGAITNRLEFAHSNVYSTMQNTEFSLSTIRDADFAVEAANLAKSEILTQAGSSMLVQANNLSQNILSLLG
ncbi:hypothetical protein CMK18_20530 [Candidatus Poribacteria bacterium]|nr:hypothetical protein [Candidatus Poribacteria bacterium]